MRYSYPIANNRELPFSPSSLSCKLEGLFLGSCAVATIASYALVAYERYRIVCTPLRLLTFKRAYQLYMVMWLYVFFFSGIADTPLLGGLTETSGSFYCHWNFWCDLTCPRDSLSSL